MYCGSCLRDNALAAELKRQGHEVILLPLYTPTRTDEPNVSEPKVFLNGISVCLCQEAAFFRRTAPAAGPVVGCALDAEAGIPNVDPGEPAFAGRDDGFHAARGGRLSAQGYS